MRTEKPILLALILAGITACGKQGTVALNVVNSGASDAGSSKSRLERIHRPSTFLNEAGLDPVSVGAASATQVKSLKYYISEIKLCPTLQVKGTGWMASSDCARVYASFDDIRNYDTYLVDQAKADTNESHYIDLMNIDAARRKLNQTASIPAGEYNYGIISWMKPIKLDAEVTLGDGTTLVTRSDLTTVQNDAFFHMTAESLVGKPGESEEAVILLNNGGSFFKFQKPLVIRDKELTTLDLVFNPDSIVKGSSAARNYALQEAVSAENGPKAISVPYLQMTPVVRGSSETIEKETYHLHASKADLRVEVYTVKEDASRSIRGIDLRTVYTAETDANLMDPGMVIEIRSNADGTLDLIDSDGGAIVSGFSRLETAGQTGTAKLGCASAAISRSQLCGAETADSPVDVSLIGISEVK